ncbi:helix-turn-helix domain-containing protein [Xylophilus rhododendri]|uniref:Helix-turn-helix domain-containing protein n=1 Tax=Xylophilus rhododendri TaxID=2697032 RepID=A0A857J174_9BURK|nr:helix-turn-helix transcriptional regulator [Xylophilus rhododendri]QHI97337.1 helix-turn-helix domain-containing protein [Xylophilus rhododendri]
MLPNDLRSALLTLPPLRPPRRKRQAASPAEVGAVTPHLYQPTPQRPVRAKQRLLRADTLVMPHRHPWPQLTFSSQGVIRLTTARGTIIVPPLRAAWVPAGMEHSVDTVEDAEIHTLYLQAGQPSQDPCWSQCVVLELGALLQALMRSLDTRPDGHPGLSSNQQADCAAHECLVAPLLQKELARAPQMRMGVPLPDAVSGDKRLRVLCEAVLRAPGRRATLGEWAAEAGASERTAARLFRSELGLSWQQWRQQATLAHALPLLARGMPVAHVAAASGYDSDSAFIAMFRAAMGRSPRHFRGAERMAAPAGA